MAYLGTPIDTTNQFQSLQGKRFSGNGSATAFTLDVAPSSTLDIEVFVENVRQDPNSAYSLSGTTLTFAAAPPNGTNNIYVVHQAKAVGTIEVLDGAITTAKINDTAVTTAKITDANVTTAKIADNAITNAKVNDDLISGATALTSEPADTDEFLVSDAGTLKRIDYSLIKASDGLGVGQTYSEQTSNRSIGTTYTNSTGKPIFVFVSADSCNDLYGIVGSSNAAYAYDGAGGNRAEVDFIVPNGSTYRVTVSTGPSNFKWYELR